MQCREFEDRLNFILDERGDPEADEALMEHARECRSCARRCSALLKTLALLSLQPLPQPRANLADRVVAELHQPRKPSDSASSAKHRRVMALLATAALLLVASVWLAASWNRQQPAAADRVPPPRARAAKQPLPSAVAESSGDTSGHHSQHAQPDDSPVHGAAAANDRAAGGSVLLPKLAREATDTYRDLAADTRQSLEVALLALPNIAPAAGEPADPFHGQALLVQAGTAATSWVKPVAAPIQRSAAQALRSLMVVVPSASQEPGS